MSELIYFFGNGLTSIFAFIAVLSVIVFIHEFGHYIVARWCGIHSDVFSLGFGPVLWSCLSKGGTRWQIAVIPLGGYVRFRGDRNLVERQEGQDEDPLSFIGAPLWARALTVIAGPLANFILSTIIFAALAMSWGIVRDDELVVGKIYDLPAGVGDMREGDEILSIEGRPLSEYDQIVEQSALGSRTYFTYQILRDGRVLNVEGPALVPPRVAGIQPRSAAIAAGVKEGDVFLRLDGKALVHFSDIGRIIHATEGRELSARIWRNGEEIEKVLRPLRRDVPKAGGGFESRLLIGISGDAFFESPVRPAGVFEASALGLSQTWQIISQSIAGITSLIAGDIDRCNLQGPVGIAKTSGDFVAIGVEEFIGFIGILSAAIGLMNLFPIPVLDGGHLMLYAYEAVMRKKPSPRIVQWLFIFGLFLLLGLMAFALTNDILCP